MNNSEFASTTTHLRSPGRTTLAAVPCPLRERIVNEESQTATLRQEHVQAATGRGRKGLGRT